MYKFCEQDVTPVILVKLADIACAREHLSRDTYFNIFNNVKHAETRLVLKEAVYICWEKPT